MSVRRVMGSETEFGVLAVGEPQANATVLSTRVVTGYALRVARELSREQSGSQASQGQPHVGTGWDYGSESPLSDARGYSMSRDQAHPSQLTDQAPVLTAEEIAAEAITESAMYTEDMDWRKVVMNTVIPNGARVYVDHSHPEYSSPEVTTPLAALTWDAAGDVVAARAVAELARGAEKTGTPPVNLYKNNTDNKSVSYGAHENYVVDRAVAFDRIAAALLPFFATRQIMCGAGRVGLGVDGNQPGFQLSQRADFFERTVGLETTIHRPMVNTRDEPHADDTKYRRLHVIIGDANLSHTATLLKFGTTSLVLNLIEHDRVPSVDLVDPVAALQTVSHDPTVTATVALRDGRELSAVDIQREYHRAATDLERELAPDGLDRATQQVLDLWDQVLSDLARDPALLADRLDWAAKYALLTAYRQRDGMAWDDPRLIAIDLQYADVRPEKGLYHRLAAAGRIRTLVDAHTIDRAADRPPEDTRAWFRGTAVRRFPSAMVSVGWDSVNVAFPGIRRGARIAMPEPLDLTRATTGEWFDAQDVEQWVHRVAEHRPGTVTGTGVN
ncbi:proteasome accessory factor PafA2 [Kocuria sp. cx-116]|uniref:depupylase/deamidase Dop n=1 Tax=Kocuria sp. cx-116 TaxID=2771378 RepID=UPI001688CC90|nr:depupylase/deamidase Dop [Kocuria sp. cx-116]MBD2761523.1 proteasome accessory factor PafA2 [Kocuria sp. cx-116]